MAHVPRRVHGAPGSGLRAHDAHSRAARSQGRDHGARRRVRASATDRRPERPRRDHGPADHRGAGREVGALRRGGGGARRDGRDRRPASRSISTRATSSSRRLLDLPDNSNPAAQDEIFGPVASVIGYDDVDDAVRIANDSIYGLAGMVFGDTTHATKVAQRIRVRHHLGERRRAERVRAVRRLQAERGRPRDGRARLPRVPGAQAPLHRLSSGLGVTSGHERGAADQLVEPTRVRCSRRPSRMSGRAFTSTVRFDGRVAVEAVVQHDDRTRFGAAQDAARDRLRVLHRPIAGRVVPQDHAHVVVVHDVRDERRAIAVRRPVERRAHSDRASGTPLGSARARDSADRASATGRGGTNGCRGS